MSETGYSLNQRISRAVIAILFNVAVWVVAPTLILRELQSGLASNQVPFSSDFIYTFGLIIISLQALGALTVGMALSIPFVSGAYITEAYYLYSSVRGGIIAVSVSGWDIKLSFPTLLFLLMLPTLFNALKAPIAFLLDQSEAVQPSADSA